MNIQLPVHMDKLAFLAWIQGREQRYELVHGRVLMMTGGSRGHALVVRELSKALDRRLDPARWTVLTSDFAASVGHDTVRYPDVIADVAGGQLADLTATAPALIAEVLSPSSVATDLGDKSAEYLHLPSLLAYLVLSQDEPKAWVWIRGETGFSAAPEVIEGPQIVRVPALSIELPLSEIYQGFGIAASEKKD
jgi:Uma2 family endonuclease